MTDVKPVIVSLPSSSGTGGSGPVIQQGTPIYLHVVRPLVVISVRAGKAYFDSLSGLIFGTAAIPAILPRFDVMPGADIGDRLQAAALLSFLAAGASVLRNVSELFTKLDQKYPTLTV